MTFIEVLPTLNATLNATSAVLLFTGRRAAGPGTVLRHRNRMLSALAASTLFLVFYLLRFYLTGSHRFVGSPALRYVYLGILFSHMILAVVTVPLVFRSIFLGLKDRIAEHRRLVRYTYPIWMYVSVTGVVVYVMLYHLSG
jgi:putative membrane protein